ncbi:hypothetical protein BU17DRAFT_88089 [Hysterangium stoloniferum]|nr:hypothetical protein BU17DRAFT_88089 [Hysterangium stoloniferum]
MAVLLVKGALGKDVEARLHVGFATGAGGGEVGEEAVVVGAEESVASDGLDDACVDARDKDENIVHDTWIPNASSKIELMHFKTTTASISSIEKLGISTTTPTPNLLEIANLEVVNISASEEGNDQGILPSHRPYNPTLVVLLKLNHTVPLAFGELEEDESSMSTEFPVRTALIINTTLHNNLQSGLPKAKVISASRVNKSEGNYKKCENTQLGVDFITEEQAQAQELEERNTLDEEEVDTV